MRRLGSLHAPAIREAHVGDGGHGSMFPFNKVRARKKAPTANIAQISAATKKARPRIGRAGGVMKGLSSKKMMPGVPSITPDRCPKKEPSGSPPGGLLFAKAHPWAGHHIGKRAPWLTYPPGR
jgi:hypothetical protein